MPLHQSLRHFRKNAEGLLGQENPRSLRQSQYTKSKFVYRSACHCSKTVGDPKTVYEVTYEDFCTHTEDVRAGNDILKASNWEFDWVSQGRRSDQIVALYADGDDRVQGLIALRDTPEKVAVTIDLAESAPWNSKHNASVPGKEYAGVGGRLFAIAVKESYSKGYNGFVTFTAKTGLVDHYRNEFGASQIGHTTEMYLDEAAARRLYDRYYGQNR